MFSELKEFLEPFCFECDDYEEKVISKTINRVDHYIINTLDNILFDFYLEININDFNFILDYELDIFSSIYINHKRYEFILVKMFNKAIGKKIYHEDNKIFIPLSLIDIIACLELSKDLFLHIDIVDFESFGINEINNVHLKYKQTKRYCVPHKISNDFITTPISINKKFSDFIFMNWLTLYCLCKAFVNFIIIEVNNIFDDDIMIEQVDLIFDDTARSACSIYNIFHLNGNRKKIFGCKVDHCLNYKKLDIKLKGFGFNDPIHIIYYLSL